MGAGNGNPSVWRSARSEAPSWGQWLRGGGGHEGGQGKGQARAVQLFRVKGDSEENITISKVVSM